MTPDTHKLPTEAMIEAGAKMFRSCHQNTCYPDAADWECEDAAKRVFAVMQSASPIQDGDVVDMVADILARFPCRADPPLSELDVLRRREVAREIVASLPNRGVAGAAKALSDAAYTTYVDADGKQASIEGDDGEMAFIVPHDEMVELRAALNSISGKA